MYEEKRLPMCVRERDDYDLMTVSLMYSNQRMLEDLPDSPTSIDVVPGPGPPLSSPPRSRILDDPHASHTEIRECQTSGKELAKKNIGIRSGGG